MFTDMHVSGVRVLVIALYYGSPLNHSELTMESKCRGIKVRRIFCPHCGEWVTKSTFYRHKNKFFNNRTKTWIENVGASRRSSCSDSSDESDRTLEERCNVRSLEDICSADDVEEVHDDRSAALEGILMQGKLWVAICSPSIGLSEGSYSYGGYVQILNAVNVK